MKSEKFVIGTRQVKKYLINDKVEYIWLAEDSNYNIIKEIIELCEQNNILIKRIGRMEELGEMFEIDVKATSVAILKQ